MPVRRRYGIPSVSALDQSPLRSRNTELIRWIISIHLMDKVPALSACPPAACCQSRGAELAGRTAAGARTRSYTCRQRPRRVAARPRPDEVGEGWGALARAVTPPPGWAQGRGCPDVPCTDSRRKCPADLPLQAETLPMPKIPSAQVRVAIRFRRRPDELVALRRSARSGMMIGCAAPICLPDCDERVRATTASYGERPGQRCRDPGAAPPDHDPGATAG